MLQKIKDLSIRVKLFAVLLLPLAGMLYYAGITFYDRLKLNQEMKQLQFTTELLTESIHTSYELMNEASSYQSNTDTAYAVQRTDQQLERFRSTMQVAIQQLRHADLQRQLQQLKTSLQKLLEIRTQAQQQKDPIKMSQGYVALITEIKSVVDQLSRMNTHSETAPIANALTMLLSAQVRAAQEEWILSHTFSNDSFPDSYYGRFIKLSSEQATYLATFSDLVDDSTLKTALLEIEESQTRQEINKLHDSIRQIYLDGNFGIGQSKENWHKLSQSWRDQLYRLSEQGSHKLIQRVEQKALATENSLITLVGIQVCIVTVILLLSLSVIRIISGQLISLNQVIMKIAQQHDLRLRIPVFSRDEIGQASRSFNNMLDAFVEIIQQVREASTQLSSAADNTLKVSHQMELNIGEGHQQVEMVATAMEEMHSTVQEVAQYAADAMLQADSTNKQTAEGRNVVGLSISAIRQLEQDLAHSSQTVNSLSADTADIESMVDVIRTIAEQTNLLALNAAIEAARAGEQGRGFAVVADEVRTLAQRTQDSTREIEAVISRVRLSSDQTVKVMQHSFDQVRESTQHADNAQVALDEISQSIVKITDMNTQVATATEQQSVTVEEINRNVSHIRQRYSETAAASHKVEQSSQTLSDLSHRLENMVQQFSV